MQEQQVLNSNFSDVLSQNTLQDLVSKKLLTVCETWSIKRLSQFFLEHNISGAPVTSIDEKLLGVVTQSDIIRFESSEPTEEQVKKLVANYSGPFGASLDEAEINRIKSKANDYCTVNTIMTPHVLSIEVNDSIENACGLLIEKEVHRLFITENEQLVGVITAMDILKIFKKN
jgi:predicted transcriptional regulator